MKPKLAIITTHPIQYYAPLFRLLQQRGKISIKVFYTMGLASIDKFDNGFGKKITWDIPLLEGYSYEWVENKSANPGSHHFKGIITPGLQAQISAWNPDAVLIYGWAYQGHLSALRYFKKKIPVYFRGDSTLLDKQNGFLSILKTAFLKWVYRHVDHAFYVGTNNRAYYKKYGLKNAQLSFAPHAIDNERFGMSRENEAFALRKSLGILREEVLILFAGKFEETKSPDLLLEAFLRSKKTGVHLLFVGNGNLENLLQAKAGEHKNIHFMKFQNQSVIPVVYQACNIFCLPSKGETWGLAVNEAMACKKAIIASDKCGCAVDLVKRENGIIFRSGSLDELSSALSYLADHPASVKKFGEKSGAIINQWNFERTAKAIEKQLIIVLE